MSFELLSLAVWLGALVGVGLVLMRLLKRRRRFGSAAGGGVYDWLNEDKRRAIEVVSEGRAAAGSPENRVGTDDPAIGPERLVGGAPVPRPDATESDGSASPVM